jgi:hypothetical protein
MVCRRTVGGKLKSGGVKIYSVAVELLLDRQRLSMADLCVPKNSVRVAEGTESPKLAQ